MNFIDSIIEIYTYILANDPPSLVVWISTIFVLIHTTLKIYEYWKYRERIHVVIVNAHQYWRGFDERDIKTWGKYLYEPAIGDPQLIFYVIELVVTNHYTRAITINRLIANKWMYIQDEHLGAYMHKKRFLAYDLYTREKRLLDSSYTIPPRSSLGFRIEAIEEIPVVSSGHTRSAIDLPSRHKLVLYTEAGIITTRKKPITVNIKYQDEFRRIYRWSDNELLNSPYEPYAMLHLPQGIKLQHAYPSMSTLNQIKAKAYIWFSLANWNFKIKQQIKKYSRLQQQKTDHYNNEHSMSQTLSKEKDTFSSTENETLDN